MPLPVVFFDKSRFWLHRSLCLPLIHMRKLSWKKSFLYG